MRGAPSLDGPDPLRVGLITNHLALRRGLERLLRGRGLEVVGSADSVAQSEDLVRRRAPQVILADLTPSGDDGAVIVRHLTAESSVPVLLYSGSPDESTLLDGLEAGAIGFALKVGGPDELEVALRMVAAGQEYVDPRVQSMARRGRHVGDGVLSAREREILELLGRGLSGDQIAGRLYLSPETVRTHVRNAMRKLRATTRVHAVVLAAQRREIIWTAGIVEDVDELDAVG